jgi:predicted Kef-type K+ transport protein
MDLGWMVLVGVAFALGSLVVYTMLKVSGDCDSKARRTEKELFPFSDVTVTHAGWDR